MKIRVDPPIPTHPFNQHPEGIMLISGDGSSLFLPSIRDDLSQDLGESGFRRCDVFDLIDELLFRGDLVSGRNFELEVNARDGTK
jgi:hypothetical protein